MTFDSEDLETVKDAIQFAIWRCEEQIEKGVDGWTKQGLEEHKEKFEKLLEQLQ